MDLRPETMAVIELKFERSLEAHKKHRDELKELFDKLGIPFKSDAVVAYFLGVLRAISYDSKGFVEGGGLEWEEFKEIANVMIGKILSTAEKIAAP